MICKFCNIENETDAVYCKHCGKKLVQEPICSNCGCKNEEDANFCKHCGNTLNVISKSTSSNKGTDKEEIMKIGKFIMKIVSVCFCSLIIILSFGACFSPFLLSDVSSSGTKSAMGFFSFIEKIREYQLPERIYGSEFHFLSYALPEIIGLIGSSLALLGCSICLIYGISYGIKVASKGQIPDLRKPALLSTCSLLLGYLVISLMFTSMSASVYFTLGAVLQGGGLVMATIGLGIAWYLLSYIGNAVLDLIENFEMIKLRNYIFRVGEFILLLIVLFNISSNLVRLTQSVSLIDIGNMELQFSGIMFLSLFSNVIYNQTQTDEYFSFEGDLAVSYYFVIVCCVLALIAVILLSIFFMLRVKKKENKSSISTGVVYFLACLVLLIVSCITVQMLKGPNGGASFIISNLLGFLVEDSTKVSLSSNLIVTMIFSTGLFVLEIVWNRLETLAKPVPVK